METPLEGATICAVPGEHLSRPYDRVGREIAALQEAGANIIGLYRKRSNSIDDIPLGVVPAFPTITSAQLNEALPQSFAPNRLTRVTQNAVRNVLRSAVRYEMRREVDCTAALDRIAPGIDVIWALGYWSLKSALDVGIRRSIPVVYETLDLDPHREFLTPQQQADALETEAALIGHVGGFITACESYADYYDETHTGTPGYRRPTVHDNAPNSRVSAIKRTGTKRRFIFQGNLHWTKFAMEIIEACALAGPGVEVALQGHDAFPPGVLERYARALGVSDRLKVIGPCDLDETVTHASNYDFGIVALPDIEENMRRASTTKLFVYMAAGLAVIGSDTPGISLIVKRHQNGVLVGDGSPAAWAEAMDRLAALPAQQVDAMKKRSVEGIERYTWTHQKPAFLAEFSRALSTASRS